MSYLYIEPGAAGFFFFLSFQLFMEEGEEFCPEVYLSVELQYLIVFHVLEGLLIYFSPIQMNISRILSLQDISSSECYINIVIFLSYDKSS